MAADGIGGGAAGGDSRGSCAGRPLLGVRSDRAGVGSLDDPDERGRFIIDSAMNMPLLFFAAEETGRREYRDIAVTHLDQCVRWLVRSTGSTAHTCFVDVETGEQLRVRTHQGLSDESCWARGQAWALYGFALAYRYTGEERFREAARLIASYFVAHLLPDRICAWDVDLRAGDNPERDTSAAAIAASGLFELASVLSADDSDRPSLARRRRRDGRRADGGLCHRGSRRTRDPSRGHL
jgi:unsaturated chondroitin disaccharide hydrolase